MIMANYRLKRVLTNGWHYFEEIKVRTSRFAFAHVENCIRYERDLDYIDIYSEDKKIATFYK